MNDSTPEASSCARQPGRLRRLGHLRATRLAAGAVGTAALAFSGLAAGGAFAAPNYDRRADRQPIAVTVFSPGAGDHSGAGGVGFIVDLALDATKAKYNHLISAASGYKPYFNDPAAPTFHPGPDPGAPGLVVLLSRTPNKPGTPFHGPDTNLAGLFQINGVASVGGKAETWNTWQPGKPLFGMGRATLTVYVVKGTAPAVVTSRPANRISNVVHVPFDIAG
ncbi:MAG: hypothetical protein ACYC91_18870 [Solirubrobacteraceae bacterium]